MSLRFPKPAPAWLYGDPGAITDGMMRWLARQAGRATAPRVAAAIGKAEAEGHSPRDRYYTMDRRRRVRQLLRGGR